MDKSFALGVRSDIPAESRLEEYLGMLWNPSHCFATPLDVLLCSGSSTFNI